MSTNETPPIIAPNPTVDQAWAALRQILLALGGWAIGRGYLKEDTALAIGTILMIGIPFVYGQWQTIHRAKQIVAIKHDPRVSEDVVK